MLKTDYDAIDAQKDGWAKYLLRLCKHPTHAAVKEMLDEFLSRGHSMEEFRNSLKRVSITLISATKKENN